MKILRDLEEECMGKEGSDGYFQERKESLFALVGIR